MLSQAGFGQPGCLTTYFKRNFEWFTEKGFPVNDSFEANLNLKNEKGEYNLLAELLADKNNIPFIFVKFQGSNKSSISERNDFGYGCILTTYTKIKNKLIAENTCLLNTTVRPRIDKYLYDIDSVNEAILNAIVHKIIHQRLR